MGKRASYFHHFLKNLRIVYSYSIAHKNPKISSFLGQKDMTLDRAQSTLKAKILEGKPFAAIRFGGMEMSALNRHEKIALGYAKKYPEKTLYVMKHNAGFYPADHGHLEQYANMLLPLLEETDILGVSGCYMESYFAANYCKNAVFLLYEYMEPLYGDWTTALKGKKVLVIYPFSDLIQSQYKKRELLFPSKPEILPEFELKTLEPPMTLGDEQGEHGTFFEELEILYKKMSEIDYDIALIGAGAYGTFLAFEAKKQGKMAIQIGGATQTLFGILGKRWEKRAHVAQYVNEHWVRPTEKPKGAEKVDGGAYW